jgi:hypothetical protein
MSKVLQNRLVRVLLWIAAIPAAVVALVIVWMIVSSFHTGPNCGSYTGC